MPDPKGFMRVPRQDAPKRDRPPAPACHEAFRPVDVRAGDEQVATEPIHEWPATCPPHGVGDQRADQLCHRSYQDDPNDAQLPLTGERPGEAKGDRGRNRHAACPEEREQENRGMAPVDKKRLYIAFPR